VAHEREDRLRRAIAEDGIACRKVVGMSMAPTLLPGEAVFVEACSEPRRGDIVAFSVDGSLLVHRIVRLDADTVTCRGDNRLSDDPTVPRDALLGKVVQIAGRDRVPDARRDVMRVRVRLTLFRLLRRPRRIAGEFWLLASQLGLGAGPRPLAPGRSGWDGSDPECSGAHVLDPSELRPGDDGVAADRRSDSAPGGALADDLPPGTSVIVPAGIFGRLSVDARAGLLRRLAGRTVTVWVLSSEAGGRATRVTAALRKSLARSGVKSGEPGDMYGPPNLDGPGGRFHAFTAKELAEVLRAAGGDEVAVEPRSLGGAQFLRGRALLSDASLMPSSCGAKESPGPSR